MNQPEKEPAHAQHASGVSKGECSRQQIHSEHDEVMKEEKKPRAPHCFQCKCNGHTAEDCTSNLDCVVCNKDSHLSRKCPIVKMTKPHATLFGLGKERVKLSPASRIRLQDGRANSCSYSSGDHNRWSFRC
jgi:hypothetical protein